MSTALLFPEDLTPAEATFPYKGETFTIREATEAAACAYRNSAIRAAKMVDGKVVGLDAIADGEPLLVSMCVFDPKGNPVPLATVKEWPSRMVRPLFDWIKDVSQLDEAETVESLKKQVVKLNERITKLGGDDPAKKPQEPGMAH